MADTDNINITIENPEHHSNNGNNDPKSLVDKFLGVLSGSRWMQVGIMFMCIGIMYVMMTGGTIKVLGFTIMDTQLDDCKELYLDNHSRHYLDSTYSN